MIRPTVFYRPGNWCQRHRIPFIPWLMQRLCFLVCNADISMACSIGKNVSFGHWGLGVVLNHRVVIEDNVIIYHHVTIGRSRGISDTDPDRLQRIVVGKNTLIGANVVILGKGEELIIGENCEIGSGAVVLADLPPNSIAVGVPARVIGRTSR